MSSHRVLPSFLSALCVCLLVLAPAATLHAQSLKIFVASNGNDASDGSRGTPKRNFQAAHDAVAAGGQIVVLDTAGYGPLTITKSLAITVPPGVNGFITIPGGHGITINAAATDVVSLRGLIIEGPDNFHGTGIEANSLATLVVEDCAIRNFVYGIEFKPANNAHLTVRGGSVRNVQYGLLAEGVPANIVVDAVVTGFAVDGAVNGAVVTNAYGAAASVTATLKDCVLTHNFIAIQTDSDGSIIVADNCVVSGNTYGFSKFGGHGIFYTRGNNTFSLNSKNDDGYSTATSFGGY